MDLSLLRDGGARDVAGIAPAKIAGIDLEGLGAPRDPVSAPR